MLELKKLSDGLHNLFINRPPTTSSAATRWAAAYTDYAQDATALDAKALSLEPNKQALTQLFSVSMDAKVFLDAFGDNLVSFWVTPPAAFQSATFAGVVLPPLAGLFALRTAFKLIIEANKISEVVRPMDNMAIAIDAFTRTVTVNLINTATGTPVPTPLL